MSGEFTSYFNDFKRDTGLNAKENLGTYLQYITWFRLGEVITALGNVEFNTDALDRRLKEILKKLDEVIQTIPDRD